jgi:hypothetical protein
MRKETRSPSDLPPANEQLIDQVKKQTESSMMSPNHWSPLPATQKDQTMAEFTESPAHNKTHNQIDAKRRLEGVSTPKTKLCFGLSGMASPQVRALEASTNPFASPDERTRIASPTTKS